MWIQLGWDMVNLTAALRVERDGAELLVSVPAREFRSLEPELADDVEAYLRATDGWLELRSVGERETRRATYVNLATTTSIRRVEDEYRMYFGEAEFASVSVADAGSIESMITRGPLARPAATPESAERQFGGGGGS